MMADQQDTQEQANNEPSLLDDFLKRAEGITPDNYGEFLQEVAEHTTGRVLDDIKRNRIINALAVNKAIEAGKMLIKKSLSKTEQDLRQAESKDYQPFELMPDGVYYTPLSKDGEPGQPRKICAPLHILASTADDKGHSHGLLLSWKDSRHIHHEWAMPAGHMAGDGVEIVRELLNMGLWVKHGNKAKVIEYIQSVNPEKQLESVTRTGWHKGVFVMPDKVYGADAGNYIYQSEENAEATTGAAGTLKAWRDNIAAFAPGNSRLVFAISAAFAGNLLEPAKMESGGFHIHGNSSTGKSTAQILAASVWGKPENYKHSWRSTSNGLEGVAALHSDNLLILDEIKEATGKEVAETAYMLGNGQGKTRAKRTGGARMAKTWRLMFLSSGEITLADLLQAEGKQIHTGQEIRIANIPADAGAGMGMIEALHRFQQPAALADHIRDQSADYYGTAGAAWLERITQDYKTLRDTLPRHIDQFVSEVLPDKASGQARRVARRFALVAFAGELAARYGITGWEEGEATAATKHCFSDWLSEFGIGNREEQQILDTVRDFIEGSGERFQRYENVDGDPLPDQVEVIKQRVGFWKIAEEGGRYYIILASQLKEVCKPYSVKQTIPVLQKAGWLNPPTTDKYGKKISSLKLTLPTLGQKKCYELRISED